MHTEKSLSAYQNNIHNNYLHKINCGINLQKIGTKTEEITIPVSANYPNQQERNSIDTALKLIAKFILKSFVKTYTKPLRFKINIIDNAINEYTGIGLLNVGDNWIDFTLAMVWYDKAEQAGETICVLFDTEFRWAISLMLLRGGKTFRIEKYQQ